MRVDPTFLLIVVLLGWGVHRGALLIAWILIVTVSVLLHELGHAFAFRRFGQRPQILLQGMGGLTSGSGEPLSPRQDLAVSLAGPLTGIVLLGLPALLVSRSDLILSNNWETIVADLVFVNIAWSVVNLLPVLPLDGGRVTAALWSLVTGRNGEGAAQRLSVAVAGAVGVLALSTGYIFGALFAGFFLAYNISQLSNTRNAGLQQRLLDGWRSLGRDDPHEARATAQAVLGDRPSGPVMTQATELLSWARYADDDVAGAEEALRRLPHGTQPNPFLQATLDLAHGRRDEAVGQFTVGYAQGRFGPFVSLAADAAARNGVVRDLVDRLLGPGGPGATAAAQLAVHLHAAERYDEAVHAGQRALEAGPDDPGRVAYNLACSHAGAGQLQAALDCLERASALGFTDVSLLDSDADLSPLRSEARYRALRQRLGPHTSPT